MPGPTRPSERYLSRYDWLTLRRWGNSRIIQTSYLWLVLIPIAARSLETLDSRPTFSVLGADLEINLALPFRWGVFYLMAVSFAIAQAAFAVKCPAFIKRYSDFQDFQARHAGLEILSGTLYQMYKRAMNRDFWGVHYLVTFFDVVTSIGDSEINRVVGNLRHEYSEHKPLLRSQFNEVVAACFRDNRALNDLFDILRYSEARRRRRAMLFSLCFFFVGALLFLWMAVESFVTVVGIMMGQ